jgi:hypothetical protein
VVPELPSVVTAFLTLAPAGLAYLAVTRMLKVPEALDLTRRIDVLTSRARR